MNILSGLYIQFIHFFHFFQNSFSWIYRVFIGFIYNVGYFLNEIIQNTHYNIDHLPLHLFILSIIVTLIIFIYIKLAYPFWSTQPVYHTYDFWRGWFTDPTVIQTGYPSKTRFYKSDRIHTYDYLELSDIQKKQTVDLIQSFAITDESVLYMFHLGNFDTYMTGQSHPSFVSLYYEDAFIPIPKMNPLEPIIDIVKKPIGCITSRSIELFFNNTNNKIMVYFLDFITVNREKAYININISRELIHTHEYNQRKSSVDNSKTKININDNKTNDNNTNSDPIQISLFKKENSLSEGIVPLVSYISTIVYIKNERIKKLPPHFLLVKIHRRNISVLMDFIEISKTQFQCFGIAELANLASLIHGGLLKVYIIQKGEEIYAAYFFRDSRTQFDSEVDSNSGALLILCGSIRNTKSMDLFYMGFLHSLRSILRETDIFKLLLFEGISQNSEIQERYIGKSEKLDINKNENNNKINIIGENPSAYYVYNYIVPKQPFSPEMCFMVF